VGSPFDQMIPEGVLGLGPKARQIGDPIPTIEHLFKKKAFGPKGKNMFSLYFGHNVSNIGGLNQNLSHIWLGGYSHRFLRTVLKKPDSNKTLTDKEIDD
jgi:hypothetical protein